MHNCEESRNPWPDPLVEGGQGCSGSLLEQGGQGHEGNLDPGGEEGERCDDPGRHDVEEVGHGGSFRVVLNRVHAKNLI